MRVPVSTNNFICIVPLINGIMIAVLTLNGKMGMEKGYEQMLGLYPNTLNDLLLYTILLGLHNNLRF